MYGSTFKFSVIFLKVSLEYPTVLNKVIYELLKTTVLHYDGGLVNILISISCILHYVYGVLNHNLHFSKVRF